MNFQDAQIGLQIVRTSGDYMTGTIGEIIERDEAKQRVRISWQSANSKPFRTWVKVEVVESTAVPYTIIPGFMDEKSGKYHWSKYIRK